MTSIRRILLKLVAAISRIGAAPTDSPELQMQRAIQVNTVVLGGLPFQWLLVLWFVSLGLYTSAIAVAIFAFVSLASLLWLAWSPRHYPAFQFLQLLIAVLSPTTGTLLLGGFLQSGLMQLWG